MKSKEVLWNTMELVSPTFLRNHPGGNFSIKVFNIITRSFLEFKSLSLFFNLYIFTMIEVIGNYDWMKIREFFVSSFELPGIYESTILGMILGTILARDTKGMRYFKKTKNQ